MTAQVTIIIQSRDGVLTLPASALGSPGRDGSYRVGVYDEATGTTEPTEIKVGLNNNITAEITEGLNEGDRVVAGAATLSGTRPSSGGAGGGGAFGGLGGGGARVFVGR